ncbi:hypothetical protein SAMN05444358_11540 [Ruegeria halocynthiae]|uniref:Uncharacterized protein n=1 Tax=Ruegeria halocynthiae TaxID=985054 RepID=A0A1H3FI84_9RHOB|nr:hypothetical protein SAMN05444358_11540 [Ruegeria halocynthiae]
MRTYCTSRKERRVSCVSILNRRNSEMCFRRWATLFQIRTFANEQIRLSTGNSSGAETRTWRITSGGKSVNELGRCLGANRKELACRSQWTRWRTPDRPHTAFRRGRCNCYASLRSKRSLHILGASMSPGRSCTFADNDVRNHGDVSLKELLFPCSIVSFH